MVTLKKIFFSVVVIFLVEKSSKANVGGENDLLNLPQEYTNTLFILQLFTVLSENRNKITVNCQPGEIRKDEVKQIRKIYEIFHNCQSTELFYQHVKNYNDIRTTELILDTTFEWEIYEAHCSNKCEAIGKKHALKIYDLLEIEVLFRKYQIDCY